MSIAALIVFVGVVLQSPVVLDRIAVVVNRHPIKLSDIDRDIRLTDFLNKTSLDLSSAEKKTSEERLIDQELIRAEALSAGFRRATEQDAETLMRQIRHERYADSEPAMKQALQRYGVSESQLQEQLVWQLTVLNFIAERFRAGVLVSDSDIQSYYEGHRRDFPAPFNESVSKSVRQLLEGQQVNQQFEEWLTQARKDATLDYKTDALK